MDRLRDAGLGQVAFRHGGDYTPTPGRRRWAALAAGAVAAGFVVFMLWAVLSGDAFAEPAGWLVLPLSVLLGTIVCGVLWKGGQPRRARPINPAAIPDALPGRGRW